MTKARDEFSPDTKRRLAQRAGYLCSLCNRLTVGPSDESDRSVNLTGVAAHISGASEGRGSRRYRRDITHEQRKDINNGIWLCETHADLIDGDEVFFTEVYLGNLKKNHETKIHFQHLGVDIEKGIFTEIEIDNFGKFRNTRIELSKNNLILGNNSTGKSILCEFFACLKDSTYLKRWEESKNQGNSFVTFKYFKSEECNFKISINSQRNISYSYNDVQIPILKSPATIFYLNKSYMEFVRDLDEDISLTQTFVKYFDLRESEFLNFISYISTSKKYIISDFILNVDKDDFSIRLLGRNRYQSFNSLSSGEKYRVLLEMALQLSIFYSKVNSTILVIDQEAFPSMDSTGYNYLINVIVANNFDFQFILATYYIDTEIVWDGINCIELENNKGNIKVKQLTKNIMHLTDRAKIEDESK